MTDSVDHLIADLSKAPRPTQKAQSPVMLFLTWFVGACLYITLLVTLHFHPRADLAEKMAQPLFMAEIDCLAALAATSAISATLLSFPDLYQKRSAVYAPIAVFAVFAVILLLEWLANTPPSPPPDHTMECCGAITLFALPLALWMFMRIRRMAPVQPALAGGCALLSSFSVSALALRFSEQTDSISHIVEWHYLPMLGIGIIGLWLGQKFFKW